MKFAIPIVAVILLQAQISAGQRAQPDRIVPSIGPKMEEIPTPSGTPEPQAAPDLLPASNQLLAEPPDLRFRSPSILKSEGSKANQTLPGVKQLSPEELEKNRAKLVEIRGIAMRYPRIIDLLKEADSALTDEARREFMRAYYHTLCTRMRMLEPGLTGAISDYEHAQIRQLAQGPAHIAIVSLEPHRRQRRARQ